jgi:hypothetical protein
MRLADYFVDDPLHIDMVCRRCFRMNQKLFLKIVFAVEEFKNLSTNGRLHSY